MAMMQSLVIKLFHHKPLARKALGNMHTFMEYSVFDLASTVDIFILIPC